MLNWFCINQQTGAATAWISFQSFMVVLVVFLNSKQKICVMALKKLSERRTFISITVHQNKYLSLFFWPKQTYSPWALTVSWYADKLGRFPIRALQRAVPTQLERVVKLTSSTWRQHQGPRSHTRNITSLDASSSRAFSPNILEGARRFPWWLPVRRTIAPPSVKTETRRRLL